MTSLPQRTQRATRARSAVAVLAVVVQVLVVYWPVVTVQGPVIWTDKVVHALVFAVPTYAVGRALGSVRTVVLAFALHAPVSELVQHFLLPGRSGDPWDAVADLAGVALGAAALVVRARPRR
jgi:VanZ family protein